MPPTLRHLAASADLRNALSRRSFRDEKRRKHPSRFRGVPTTSVHSTAEIKSFFDQCASSGFAEQHGDAKRLLDYRLGLVRDHAQLRPNDVVLDLGCGNGHHLIALAPEIARGIGVDLSPGMIELARTRLGRSPWGARLKFEVDDTESLRSVAAQSIDLAVPTVNSI